MDGHEERLAVRGTLVVVRFEKSGRSISIWMTVVVGAGLLAAVTLRLVVATVNASSLGASEVNLSAVDVLLISLIASVAVIALIFVGVHFAIRRAVALAEDANPGAMILPVGMRSEEIELVRQFGHEGGLGHRSVYVVAVTVDTITWWTGLITTRQVAELRSERPIDFRIGKYMHGPGAWSGVLAGFEQDSTRITMPIPIAPNRVLPIPPNAETLERIVEELRSLHDQSL